MTWLEEQLNNYGLWLNYDCCIGPELPRCRSIESGHLPELGEVYDEPTAHVIPDVAAAERIHKIVQEQLNRMEQIALAVRYGGLPAVFKYPRMSDYNLNHLADNAELVLVRYLERV